MLNDLREVYSDFDIEFGRNRVTGDVIKKKNADSIKQALRLLIDTRYYSRVWHPEVGSYVQSLLFKQNDNYIRDIERTELTKLITENEPRITLGSIKFNTDLQELDSGIITIEITYTIKTIDVKDTFVYYINRIR